MHRVQRGEEHKQNQKKNQKTKKTKQKTKQTEKRAVVSYKYYKFHITKQAKLLQKNSLDYSNKRYIDHVQIDL